MEAKTIYVKRLIWQCWPELSFDAGYSASAALVCIKNTTPFSAHYSAAYPADHPAEHPADQNIFFDC
ncbi:hypothetical protein ACO0LC_10755 [Undibacterium sp. JH2W]|uniref:hypothetical protein n=1 Tax=Undibacterium sp. JH2W TaxID=3413037 RepID=UPI003BF236E4